MAVKKIIMDVDTGIDDALAIAYAAASPEVELLGISTTYGMVSVDYTYRNTLKVLEYLGVDVPVYSGSDKPLVLSCDHPGVRFHGEDGLGNAVGTVAKSEASAVHAVDFLIEQIRKHGKELTLVTTAPLTNLAHAITKDPEITGMIGRVVTMGGAVTTPGNVSKFAEANIRLDPHAAQAVFQSELPITLVGLDVTRKTLLTRKNVEDWRVQGTPIGAFLADVTDFYLAAYEKHYPYLEGCALHDPLAVGVVTHPDLVRTLPMYIQVDLEDDALGRTTEDLYRKSPHGPNVDVCVDVDGQRFVELFLSRIAR